MMGCSEIMPRHIPGITAVVPYSHEGVEDSHACDRHFTRVCSKMAKREPNRA